MVIMERTKVSLSVVGVLLVCATSLASGTPWSNWSECTQTCGYGVQLRHRPCPQEDHAECTVSELVEHRRCKLRECPIDGGWSDWTEWSACNAVWCRVKGNRFRTRSCTNPEPLNGGSQCEGAPSESEKCKKADCPVHGGWSAWRDSTSCSSTCGFSTRNQTRTCDNPAPRPSTVKRGRNCIGPSWKMIRCRGLASCPRDNGVSPPVAQSNQNDESSSFWSSYIHATSTTPEDKVIPEDSQLSSVSSVADPDEGPEPLEGADDSLGWSSEETDDGLSWSSESAVPTTPENEQSSVIDSQVDLPANPENKQPSDVDAQVDLPPAPGEECDPGSDPNASSFC